MRPFPIPLAPQTRPLTIETSTICYNFIFSNSTRWSGHPPGQACWISVDLQNIFVIERIEIVFEYAHGRVIEFEFSPQDGAVDPTSPWPKKIVNKNVTKKRKHQTTNFQFDGIVGQNVFVFDKIAARHIKCQLIRGRENDWGMRLVCCIHHSFFSMFHFKIFGK